MVEVQPPGTARMGLAGDSSSVDIHHAVRSQSLLSTHTETSTDSQATPRTPDFDASLHSPLDNVTGVDMAPIGDEQTVNAALINFLLALTVRTAEIKCIWSFDRQSFAVNAYKTNEPELDSLDAFYEGPWILVGDPSL